MQRDIDILLAHRETLFAGDLQHNPWLRVFLGQALLEHDVQLECSTRVSGQSQIRSRPSMGFVRHVPMHLARCLERLEQYSGVTDAATVRDFFVSIDTARANLLIHGLELTESRDGTRIKIHVQFDTDERIRRRVMQHPQSNPAIAGLISEAEVTVGFDLFAGEPARLRNYLSFKQPSFHRDLFMSRFGSPLGSAMAEAGNIWLAWKTDSAEPFVYFVDADATRFVERLNLRGVDPTLRRYRNEPAYIFGAPLSALRSGQLSDYNLYYMLRS